MVEDIKEPYSDLYARYSDQERRIARLDIKQSYIGETIQLQKEYYEKSLDRVQQAAFGRVETAERSFDRTHRMIFRILMFILSAILATGFFVLRLNYFPSEPSQPTQPLVQPAPGSTSQIKQPSISQ